jgi:hypothetical protein
VRRIPLLLSLHWLDGWDGWPLSTAIQLDFISSKPISCTSWFVFRFDFRQNSKLANCTSAQIYLRGSGIWLGGKWYYGHPGKPSAILENLLQNLHFVRKKTTILRTPYTMTKCQSVCSYVKNSIFAMYKNACFFVHRPWAHIRVDTIGSCDMDRFFRACTLVNYTHEKWSSRGLWPIKGW